MLYAKATHSFRVWLFAVKRRGPLNPNDIPFAVGLLDLIVETSNAVG